MVSSSLGAPPCLFLGGLNPRGSQPVCNWKRTLVLLGPVLLQEAHVRDGNPHQQILWGLQSFPVAVPADPRLLPSPHRAQHTSGLGASETKRNEFCSTRRANRAKLLSLRHQQGTPSSGTGYAGQHGWKRCDGALLSLPAPS